MTEDTATNLEGAADTSADDQTGVAAAQTNEGDDDHDNQGQDAEVGDDPDQSGEAAEGAEDDLEDVEWEGKTLRLPPEAKLALMRTADYTKKTQAVAEKVREIEAKDQALTTRAEALETTIQERAELVAIERQIAAFATMTDDDWDALETEDPVQARKLARQHAKLKDAATELKGALQQKEAAAVDAKRTEFANRVNEAQAVLARDIKGWGAPLAKQITDYAKADGWTNEQLLDANTKPHVVKALHLAMTGAQALKREQAAKKVGDAQQTKPAATVGGASPSARRTTDASGDGLSTAEWMRREDARLAAKRKAG